MPIFRLTPNSYLIGAESKRMEVRGKNCTIRVGGGYVSLQEYYEKYSAKQCVSFYNLLATSRVNNFRDGLVQLLRNLKVPMD